MGVGAIAENGPYDGSMNVVLISSEGCGLDCGRSFRHFGIPESDDLPLPLVRDEVDAVCKLSYTLARRARGVATCRLVFPFFFSLT